MKSILVPTDFSAAADNAVRYAFQMAKVMKANLLLCNAIKVPAEAPMAAQVSWPLEDYSTIKKDVTAELKFSSKRFEQEDIDVSNPKSFHPHVAYTSEVGQITDVVRNLIELHNPGLVVMGMSGAGSIERLFLGSTSKVLIEKAGFPILLIPFKAIFKGITKIAFATDLHEGDIDRLNLVAGLARPFNAEILIVHVCKDLNEEQKHRSKMDLFFNKVTNSINYPHIYYRPINDMKVDEALNWLLTHGQIDMLAMVHRKHTLLDQILSGSHTQRAARKVDLPLLVIPA